jgi:hypothetical protein
LCELGARKKKEEGQKHGQKGRFVTDVDKPKGLVNPSTLLLAIETMLGYTGSVGTALWYEIGTVERWVKNCPRIFLS